MKMKSQERVTVKLDKPSPYIENHNYLSLWRRRLTHKYPINLIKRYSINGSSSSIFDIGAGSGTFLFEASRVLKSNKLGGVEYDPRLVKHANDRFGSTVVDVGNAESFCIDFPEQYDVVTSFHVIEHLYEPNKLVEQAHKLLKPNGIFIIASPNLDCLSYKIHGGSWQGIRDDHVSLKSASDWEALILMHGFQKIKSGTTFFSGLRLFKYFPLNLINGFLSYGFGVLSWKMGESFIGCYKKNSNT